MDIFTIIYKILKALEQAMDYDEFDVNKISQHQTQHNLSTLGKNLDYAEQIRIYRRCGV